MNKLLLLTLFSFSTVAGSGGTGSVLPPADLVVTDINRVYDGDTFFINVSAWPDIIGKDIGIRVAGVDTPEIRSRCKNKAAKANEKAMAIVARDYAEELLTKADRIELINMKRGSRFRIVADVYVDGKNLADLLINVGYGRAYDGKKKRLSWCH